MLQHAGSELSSVASKVLGVSRRPMLDALVPGRPRPEPLVELAKGTLRPKLPAIREALAGRFSRFPSADHLAPRAGLCPGRTSRPTTTSSTAICLNTSSAKSASVGATTPTPTAAASSVISKRLGHEITLEPFPRDVVLLPARMPEWNTVTPP